MESLPNLEMINDRQLKELGFKHSLETNKIMQSLIKHNINTEDNKIDEILLEQSVIPEPKPDPFDEYTKIDYSIFKEGIDYCASMADKVSRAREQFNQIIYKYKRMFPEDFAKISSQEIVMPSTPKDGTHMRNEKVVLERSTSAYSSSTKTGYTTMYGPSNKGFRMSKKVLRTTRKEM